MEVSRRNNTIEEIKETENLKYNYVFTPEEMKTSQTDESGVPILSKFEQTFIVPENTNIEKISVGDIRNINENKLKDNMKKAVSRYKDTDSVVTEDVKLTTENKVKELEEKKEQIKVAEEEKARKEAEEKAAAEEVARKAAEEEAAKGLKVGSYTLKYGKYTGSDFSEGTDRGPSGTATYTINADGTYTFTMADGSKRSGTYKVKSLASLGSYYSSMYGLEFSDGGMIGVPANNTLEELAGAGSRFKYTGN